MIDDNINQSNAIVMSLTGQYQLLCNGSDIFKSNDYGATFNHTKSLNDQRQIFVCISLNGEYAAVISLGDNLYQSVQNGDWIAYPIPDNNSPITYNAELYDAINEDKNMAGLAISYTGQYQTIVCGFIFTSNDYGVSWITNNSIPDNQLDGEGFPSYFSWIGIAMSSNGQHQTAITFDGNIYSSADYGITWNLLILNIINFTGISMSANGKYQTVINNTGNVYISNNYGVDWYLQSTITNNQQNEYLISISISANGQYQSVAAYGGGIYLSNLI